MKKVFCLLLFCLFKGLFSHAQTLYGLDSTFANNGIYVDDTGGYVRLVVQPDNKIIVTGAEVENTIYIYIVRRFNEDGTKDADFADNGCFKISALGLNNIIVTLLYLQPDGKILLGGSADTGITNQDFLLIRLKQDGSLDSSFGGGGYVMTSYINTWTPAINDIMSSIALQPDGKIIAYGSTNFLADTLQVIRYHPDGKVDSSFGVNGIVRLAEGFTYPKPNDIAVMPDGRIIVGVKARISALNPPWGAYAFTAIRLLPDGSLDTSFNHTGIAYTNTNFLGLLYCTTMQLQQDGKILLGGYADSIVVVRFDTSGNLDNIFGKGGIAKIAGGNNIGNNVTAYLQSDGKIYISGQIDTANYLFRRQTDGSPDYSFALNGELILYGFSIGAITTQPDAKILTAGMLSNKTAIARFLPDAANSVADLLLDDNIILFPNPTVDYLYIDNATTQRLSTIMLYSTDGKLFLTQIYPHTGQISTEGLVNGIYYLKLNFSNYQQVMKKIIVQKY